MVWESDNVFNKSFGHLKFFKMAAAPENPTLELNTKSIG